MIHIVNTSVAEVKVIPSEQSSYNEKEEEVKEENVIFIEEAFNKCEKSGLEKKLYKTKLLYTFIDIANRRILKVIQKSKEDLHKYII